MSIYLWFVFFLFVQIVHFLGTWNYMKLLAENVGKRVFYLQRYCLDENHWPSTWWTLLLLFQL
jgi:signal peptidase I